MAEDLRHIKNLADVPVAIVEELHPWWTKRGTTAQAVDIFRKHGIKTDIGNYAKWCAIWFPKPGKGDEQELLDLAWTKTLQSLRCIEVGKKDSPKKLVDLITAAGRVMEIRLRSLRMQIEGRKSGELVAKTIENTRSHYEAEVREQLDHDPELLDKVLNVLTRAAEKTGDDLSQSRLPADYGGEPLQ